MTNERYRYYISLGKRTASGDYQAELKYKNLRVTEDGWSVYVIARSGDAVAADVAYAIGYNDYRKGVLGRDPTVDGESHD